MEVVVGLVEGDGVAGIGKTTGDGWSRAPWVLTVVTGVVVIPMVRLGFRRGKFLARSRGSWEEAVAAATADVVGDFGSRSVEVVSGVYWLQMVAVSVV
ncbi:pollen-specific leucine-rich repeat extensin-like protein 3 [Iris pallida]|uniref:Pollen-specific leucine-rich repeat extensin-like protein 3 n=1 Tax=Iris pallida TaxID=29817 RepID=A0AAX6GHK3_IRIPA|nr:pollen-specific leucine-rich repeat extensin-like protein 3 [Iris pallida]